MRKYATQEVLQQSTYARNLVTLAAADATLDKIKTGDVHRAISKFGNSLMKGIRDILQDWKVDAILQGVYIYVPDALHKKRKSC